MSASNKQFIIASNRARACDFQVLLYQIVCGVCVKIDRENGNLTIIRDTECARSNGGHQCRFGTFVHLLWSTHYTRVVGTLLRLDVAQSCILLRFFLYFCVKPHASPAYGPHWHANANLSIVSAQRREAIHGWKPSNRANMFACKCCILRIVCGLRPCVDRAIKRIRCHTRRVFIYDIYIFLLVNGRWKI